MTSGVPNKTAHNHLILVYLQLLQYICAGVRIRASVGNGESKKLLGGAEENPSILIKENRSSLLIRATALYHGTNTEHACSQWQAPHTTD